MVPPNQAKANGRLSLEAGISNPIKISPHQTQITFCHTCLHPTGTSLDPQMETTTPLLDGAPTSTTLKLLENGDYAPLRSFKEVKSSFWIETVKTWKIAGSIAFQIICQYGTNSVTSMFIGHIGNVELSTVTNALTVIRTFSFGFMLAWGVHSRHFAVKLLVRDKYTCLAFICKGHGLSCSLLVSFSFRCTF